MRLLTLFFVVALTPEQEKALKRNEYEYFMTQWLAYYSAAKAAQFATTFTFINI